MPRSASTDYLFISALLAFSVLVGCDSSSSQSASSSGSSANTSHASGDSSSPVQTTELFGTGLVTGRVLFDGPRPAPKTIRMQGDRACHPDTEIPSPATIISSDGGIQHVFVYIKSGISGKYTTPGDPIKLMQRGCMFEPHVFGIQVGQKLEMINGDDTAHNIADVSKRNPRFNVMQPNKGVISTQVFSQPEVMIRLACNVHGWMQAYCGVLPHPFHAVTDAEGNFKIDRLPAGRYTIEAWHELWGSIQQDIQVENGKTIELKLTFAKEKKTA